MGRLPSREHSVAVVGAGVAHDLNDELTIMLSSIVDALLATEPGHPARPMLLDLQSASQRCSWLASSLLNYSYRHGGAPVAIPAQHLMEIL